MDREEGRWKQSRTKRRAICTVTERIHKTRKKTILRSKTEAPDKINT
jgi:hypothetical protein